MLRTRLATAAVAIPALWLVVQYLWAPLFNGFILAVVMLALLEYFAMAMPEHALDRAFGIAWGTVVAAAVLWRRQEVWGAGLALSGIGGLAFLLLHESDLKGGVHRLGLTLLGVLYLGFFTPHVVLVRSLPDGWRWLLFTVFVAMGSDSGGYFTGRAIGRHPLAPAISPSKTREGVVGAVAGAMLVAWLCRMAFLDTVGSREALVLGTAISLLAQLGDLCESALKRAFGAKDSGWIIPGHGGILDRLDSLLFPVVFTYYYAAVPRG
ncbi:MAG TPA: phosphatidate cytidylyltransferase [Candidatus Binatia bacterium]|nr:phosphatidate cytidylyltransferase [Candidatus Binatia bacterium]